MVEKKAVYYAGIMVAIIGAIVSLVAWGLYSSHYNHSLEDNFFLGGAIVILIAGIVMAYIGKKK